MSKKNKTKDILKEQTEEAQETVVQEEDVRSEEEKLQEKLQKERDNFLRLFAEFENYKKRTSRERIELFKTASEDLMKSLLPILDDLERALNHIEEDKEAEDLRKGVLLIYQKLVTNLEQKGLSQVEVKQGDVFNADNHEAITQIPAPSKNLKGKIIDVVEKGYALGDKIIRFPKVIIGQ